MRSLTLAVGAGLALLVAACGGGEQPPAGGGAAASPSAASGSAAVVKVATISLGQILVDGSGRTLYLFEADKSGASSCYSSCAALWPPLLTQGAPAAGAGAQMALVGTSTRTDGSTQVTYAGHPLYYWAADKSAGQATGQAVNNSGGVWYVVAPDGSAITKTG